MTNDHPPSPYRRSPSPLNRQAPRSLLNEEDQSDQLQHLRSESLALEREVANLESELAGLEATLTALSLEEQLQRERSLLVQTNAERMRLLAELALPLLDERCPVCQEQYNREATTRRLHALVGPVVHEEPGLAELERRVSESRSAMLARSSELALTRDRLTRNSDAIAALETALAARRRRLAELGLDSPDAGQEALRRLSDPSEALSQIAEVEREGELLLAQAASIAASQRASSLQTESRRLQLELDAKRSDLATRHAAYAKADQIITTLREVEVDAVSDEIARIQPTLETVYAKVDPHPSFKDVRLICRNAGGRGRFLAHIADAESSISDGIPQFLLSSSQLNVLAVSVFLSMNLVTTGMRLDVVALDDPLHSLDDVNLLGLVDILRRVKDRKQLIISTHDRRLASLLTRKLRPASQSQRTMVYQLSGWSRRGPTVESAEVSAEPRLLVLGTA